MTSPEFAVDDSAADQTAPRTIDHSQLPTLYVDGSFWGMTITQFFGAFNDNLFKQLILLVAVGLSAAAAAESGGALNKQGIAMLVFALPFVLFSTFAGFVSDRVSKTRVIRLAKVGEIMVMTLGLAAFVAFQLAGFKGLCVVLFLMGTQSAFFGPGKYGILPEMLREADLPRANGFFLMTTFLAIIFGTASAGWLADLVAGREPTDADPSTIDPNRLWIVSILCVAVAIAGACSSLLVRKLPPANPDLRFHGSMLAIPADMRALLAGDSLLLVTLLVSSSFWLMGGIVQPTVNEFGIDQLQQDNEKTSYLAAAMGVGIAIGCMTAGLMSRDRVRFGLARVGLYGMLGCLILLGIPAPHAPHQHLWGYRGSLPLLVGLGAFAGLFVVPLQVFMQSRPPENKKGRMIALMNLCSWIGILISAVLVIVIDLVQQALAWPKSTSFLFIAAIMLPVALFYRPKDEMLREAETT